MRSHDGRRTLKDEKFYLKMVIFPTSFCFGGYVPAHIQTATTILVLVSDIMYEVCANAHFNMLSCVFIVFAHMQYSHTCSTGWQHITGDADVICCHPVLHVCEYYTALHMEMRMRANFVHMHV